MGTGGGRLLRTLFKIAFQAATGMVVGAWLLHCSSSGPAASDANADAGSRVDPASSADEGAEVGSGASNDAGDAGPVPEPPPVLTANSDASVDAAAPDAAPPVYSPCPPAGTRCVIMPVGDSITYGYQSSTGGGYRLRLLHDIWGGSHDATFVGDSSSGPATLDGRPFPKNNEGYSGYTIDNAPAVKRAGISPLVAPALTKYSPHIVTLMIGTNDIGTNNDLSNAPTRLANLIDSITATSPKALLVVAQITPTGDNKANALTMKYNAAIPDLVKSRVAAGKHIIMVDMYSAFTADSSYRTDYMKDSLHPNDTGYNLMGDVWYAAIAPHL